MKPIRTLLVDDEPLARQGLETMLRNDPEIEIVGACADGEEALRTIRAQQPDLVFLDVQMPRRDGFQIVEALAPVERPVWVFVTAYGQHALRAFEVGAVDYLLKPYSDARFADSLERGKSAVRRGPAAHLSGQLRQLLDYVRRWEAPARPVSSDPASNESSSPPAEPTDRIILKADGALHFIRAHEVVWMEAQGDFVKVQTTTGKTQLVRETLQAMERKVPGKFLRIHRSFLVNADHVRRVETALYGDYDVYMSDGVKLRLSRNYRGKLRTFLKQNPASPVIGSRRAG